MDIEFVGVEDYRGTHWTVHRQITRDDGTVEDGVHVMPKDILESRAAEYGITDREELLDMILAEPYLTEEDWADGSSLMDVDPEQALADHRARCDKSRARMKIKKAKDRRTDHPLQRILDESPMHPEALEIKTELVRRARQDEQTRRRLQREDPERERIAQLRRVLGRGNA